MTSVQQTCPFLGSDFCSGSSHKAVWFDDWPFTKKYSGSIPENGGSWMATGFVEKNAYKCPSRSLMWWSSLVLKTLTVPAETIPFPKMFHSWQTLLANLTFSSCPIDTSSWTSSKLCTQRIGNPRSISNHLKSIYQGTNSQNPSISGNDFNQVSPQESCHLE